MSIDYPCVNGYRNENEVCGMDGIISQGSRTEGGGVERRHRGGLRRRVYHRHGGQIRYMTKDVIKTYQVCTSGLNSMGEAWFKQ